jgi:hypothetical protein
VLRTDGIIVRRVEEVPEMAAVDLSVLRMAFHLLMKVGDGQKVLPREASMTAQQIRLAMENNVMRMVPITDEQRGRMETGSGTIDDVIDQFQPGKA